MKMIHLSDLHIGRSLKECSLLEDQIDILKKIYDIIVKEKPDVVMIAGDIYDKAVPSTEAIQVLDDFLVKLTGLDLTIFIISGNHDSAERLSFGSRLMEKSKVFISPVYNGEISPVTCEDDWGKVNFYLLPFIKPVHVRRFFPEEDIKNYTDAVRVAIKNMKMDTSQRNVLLTHQYITGANRSDSEERSVGGLDNVDASVFNDIDYVALGHIHRPQDIPQDIGTEHNKEQIPKHIRYCGTPLKYSFSEVHDKKSVTVVTMGEKNQQTGKVDMKVETRELTPLHEMDELKESYDCLTLRDNYINYKNREAYLHITLTDNEEILNAYRKLKTIYPNILEFDYDNIRTRSSANLTKINNLKNKTPLEIFEEFYKEQNGSPLSREQKECAVKLFQSVTL